MFNSQPRLHHDFTEAQHEHAIEFLKDNPMLYNRREVDYREGKNKTALKERLIAELGVSMERYNVWYKSQRTEVGRLKHFTTASGGVKLDKMTLLQRSKWDELSFMSSCIKLRTKRDEIRPVR